MPIGWSGCRPTGRPAVGSAHSLNDRQAPAILLISKQGTERQRCPRLTCTYRRTNNMALPIRPCITTQPAGQNSTRLRNKMDPSDLRLRTERAHYSAGFTVSLNMVQTSLLAADQPVSPRRLRAARRATSSSAASCGRAILCHVDLAWTRESDIACTSRRNLSLQGLPRPRATRNFVATGRSTWKQ